MGSVELTLFKRNDNYSHMIIYLLKFGEITLPNVLRPVHEVYLDIGFEYYDRVKYMTLRNLLNNLDTIVYHYTLPKFRGYDRMIRKFGVYKDPFQVFCLKGEVLDSVLENYLQIIDNRLKYLSDNNNAIEKYSSIRDIIIHNRNNATRTRTIYY